MNVNMEMEHPDHSHGIAYSHGHGRSMPAIFTSGTHITLFFSSWTTSSLVSYLLILLFLFALTWLNRFLGVLKLQFDARTNPISCIPNFPARSTPASRRWYHLMNKDHMSAPHDDSALIAPRLESEWDERASGRFAELQEPAGPSFRTILRAWTPSESWSWRRNGILSLLEGARAFIGYLL